ncbi:hypothetical protein RBSWK_03292 [Rhodopirellula baltica SWK14]|uniref:Uncharacterized protein n=1 Tax=Rhodopirellula baltica SWK14 TaxID=993516 RepID=L7CG39_RHOBT|nr:hypothetical protein RBSWK_03292 [Rhodopirellula baltica SWK14]
MIRSGIRPEWNELDPRAKVSRLACGCGRFSTATQTCYLFLIVTI